MFVTCPVHGIQQAQGLVGGNMVVTIHNSLTNCPVCGRIGPMTNGTYEVVNSVVRGFHTLGATYDEVRRMRDLAKAVAEGQTSAEEATAEVAQLGAEYVKLWRVLNDNAGGIQTVLAIIALFIAVYFGLEASADSGRLEEATKKQTEAVATQTEATRSLEQVERQILERLQTQHGIIATPQITQKPRTVRPQERQGQMQSAVSEPNRHERRKTKALKGRQSRRSSS